MKNHILTFIKKEKILIIAGILAIITMFFVPPNKGYIDYINPHVLCLLFSLMAVICGFEETGAFKWIASKLLCHNRSGRVLGFILVMLPFFSSMLITNDVALITFVPFTLLILKELNLNKRAIPILVFQTIAANLGSMLTPIGSPHNLFLYTYYNLTATQFFKTLGPLTLASFVVLGIFSFFLLPKNISKINIQEAINSKGKLLVYIILFILCILTVLNLLNYLILTIIIFVTLMIVDKKILQKPDYALLLTFVFFFIVSGNLGNVEAIKQTLQNLLDHSTVMTSILASQFISNVPSSVLLSGFTNNWTDLLIGANIGGLGTPIASLASLITLKIYAASTNANISKFLLIFTLANIAMMIILLAI